jgi:hypothetical protein
MKTLQSFKRPCLQQFSNHDASDIHIIQERSLSELVMNDLKISNYNQLFNALDLCYIETSIKSVGFHLVIGCYVQTSREGCSNISPWGEDNPTHSYHPCTSNLLLTTHSYVNLHKENIWHILHNIFYTNFEWVIKESICFLPIIVTLFKCISMELSIYFIFSIMELSFSDGFSLESSCPTK